MIAADIAASSPRKSLSRATAGHKKLTDAARVRCSEPETGIEVRAFFEEAMMFRARGLGLAFALEQPPGIAETNRL
jgi:hypothetical protein